MKYTYTPLHYRQTQFPFEKIADEREFDIEFWISSVNTSPATTFVIFQKLNKVLERKNIKLMLSFLSYIRDVWCNNRYPNNLIFTEKELTDLEEIANSPTCTIADVDFDNRFIYHIYWSKGVKFLIDHGVKIE